VAKRLVLLSMEKAAAESLVRTLAANDGTHRPAMALPKSCNVEWVIAAPTLACRCAISETSGRGRRSRRQRVDGSGWTKTRHFGWWVHAACGKVSRLVVDRFIPNLTNGSYDLLPEILNDPDRTPNDIRRFGDPDENWRTKR
jgi:hypothetical protein